MLISTLVAKLHFYLEKTISFLCFVNYGLLCLVLIALNFRERSEAVAEVLDAKKAELSGVFRR